MNKKSGGFEALTGLSVVAALLALVGVALVVPGSAWQGQGAERNDARVVRGFELAPVPLDLEGKNPALVGLGGYLVTTLHCSDCHTSPPFAPGGNPFLQEPEQVNAAAYMAGGTPFGPFTSRNLTPRADGLPAGYTLEQFRHVIRTGEDLKNRHPEISDLLQVMPWAWYKDLTPRELDAIYEYLRAIPCVGSAARCGG